MGYEGLKASFYFSLWECPYSFVKYITPVVEINSGYSADLVLWCCMWRGIHINSGKFDLSCVLWSQFIQNRRLRAAMASPGGCKFDEDRSRESLHFRGKVPVRYINRSVGILLRRGKWCSTLSADTPFSLSIARDPVFRSTLRTAGYKTVVHTTQYKTYFSDFNW